MSLFDILTEIVVIVLAVVWFISLIAIVYDHLTKPYEPPWWETLDD